MPVMPQSRLLPLVLLTGVLAISTAALFIKQCDDASPAVIAAARMGIAAFVLTPLTLAVRGRRSIRLPHGSLRPILLAGLCLGAHFFFWITSLKHTSVLSSVVIVTTNPIFVGLASYLFLKERLHGGLIAGIVLAAAGGGVISLSDAGGQTGTLYGNFMSLCGAIMASSYFLIGRKVRGQVDILSYIVPVYSVAAGVLIVLATFSGDNVLGYRPATYVYFVLLALVPQLIGHSCLNWALGHASATIVAICILGEPIGASVLAFLVLREPVSGVQLIGGGLILAGIALSLRAPKQTPPAEAGL
jgi:drug/metabolite transporter (DMT)-like permease